MKNKPEVTIIPPRPVNKGSEFYLQKGALPVIVTEERFDAVQEEKKLRSNITVNSDGKKTRKDTRYTGNK